MPIEVISAESAWAGQGTDLRHRRWPGKKAPERLYPVAQPGMQAGFQIGPQEKIFCIGSCFAAELSRALHRLNYQVLSLFHELPTSANRELGEDSMFNKYNVATILNELRWALDPTTPYRHEQVLVETSGQRLQDYQLKGRGYTDEPAAAKAFREAFNQAFARVRQADVVIITLGLSEAWFDRQTGLYLNSSVPLDVARRYPGRFEVHVLDHAQTLASLEAIYTLLQAQLAPGFRLLVTVSPVPLAMTFRGQDVLVANAYSKAVLRSAVDAFVQGKANVAYFPSYEFVSLSHPQAVWGEEDFRHVSGVFVDYIMANVMHTLLAAPPASGAQGAVLAKAKVLYGAGFLPEAGRLLQPLLAQPGPASTELRLLAAAIRLGLDEKKSRLLKALEYLKTHQHLSWLAHWRQWRHQRRQARKSPFVGYIDHWQPPQLVGWALNTTSAAPVKVKVLVNGQLVATVLADQPRADVQQAHPGHLHCGFAISLRPQTGGAPGARKIQVLFADTGSELSGSPVFEA